MTQKTFEEKCKKIRLVITDVDGVLTDGGMYYSENGDELKKFSVRDGAGIILMQLAGLRIGAFTGEPTKLVERRLKKIGVNFMFSQVKDKLNCLNKYLSENNYDAKETAYVGDEINDYCLLGKVGLFFTVTDANPVIKEKADFVLETTAGQGCLREVAQILLSAQEKLDQALESYISNSQYKPHSARTDGVFVPFTQEA